MGQQTVFFIDNKLLYNRKKYQMLKDLVSAAVKDRRVFMLHGRCRTVAKALKKRGWVQKLTNKMFDRLKLELPFTECTPDTEDKAESMIINTLLKKHEPNFHWLITSADSVLRDSSVTNNPFVNRIRMDDKHFTTKEGLCSAFQFQQWFHINNVSDFQIPRMYNVFDNSELDDFLYDYKVTTCTCLMRWFVERFEEQNTNFMQRRGKASLSVIFFAIRRCLAYLQLKAHEDIDKLIKDPKPHEWNHFVDTYFKLVNNHIQLKSEDPYIVRFYAQCSKELLKCIKKYKPEIYCEGIYNTWIIKPSQSSRGRGITIENDLKKILGIFQNQKVKKYVIQKYIERPLTIYGTKFDIRQHYIITCTSPLTIWMYKECYLRFSSQRYSIGNLHESVHLTNNSIQYKYKVCEERDPNLPNNNMWTLRQFQTYLESRGDINVWNEIIYPEMKKNIIGTMLACQEGMINRPNQFELYGCDFLLDESYKPWLIEINSSPDMRNTTSVTAKLCPQVLEDMIKVVIDRKRDSRSPTGKFECIYKQTQTPYVYAIDTSALTVNGEEKRFCSVIRHSEKKRSSHYNRENKVSLPWKEQLMRLHSDEELLRYEILKIKSEEETMISKYDSIMEEDEEGPLGTSKQSIVQSFTQHSSGIQIERSTIFEKNAAVI